jgi:hypothetical protein
VVRGAARGHRVRTRGHRHHEALPNGPLSRPLPAQVRWTFPRRFLPNLLHLQRRPPSSPSHASRHDRNGSGVFVTRQPGPEGRQTFPRAPRDEACQFRVARLLLLHDTETGGVNMNRLAKRVPANFPNRPDSTPSVSDQQRIAVLRQVCLSPCLNRGAASWCRLVPVLRCRNHPTATSCRQAGVVSRLTGSRPSASHRAMS